MKTDMELVQQFKLATMKARSGLMESGSFLMAEALGTNRWLVGPQCILRAVEKIEERGTVTRSEVADLLTIANVLEPLIGITSVTYGDGGLPTTEEYWDDRVPAARLVPLQESAAQ